MIPTFPIVCLATALGLASCDSKTGDSDDPAATTAGSNNATAGGTRVDGPGNVDRKPTKTGPRIEAPGNKTKSTASGLKYTVLKKGSGNVNPKATDTVTVHYHGTLLDGSVFDSSVDRGQPASFPLDGVIPGWTEGLQLMVVGDKFEFEIPADLAYGANSPSPAIPPGSTLVFEVELLEIR
jgi:FKBP-type peptidyl-prolyl cis-trans isomerase